MNWSFLLLATLDHAKLWGIEKSGTCSLVAFDPAFNTTSTFPDPLFVCWSSSPIILLGYEVQERHPQKAISVGQKCSCSLKKSHFISFVSQNTKHWSQWWENNCPESYVSMTMINQLHVAKEMYRSINK